MLCDTLLKISDCRSFSVLKTLTGSRPEKDSKCECFRALELLELLWGFYWVLDNGAVSF